MKEETTETRKRKKEWKHNDPKPKGQSKSNAKRGTYSNKSLSQTKISNKLPNLTPKGTRKEKEQLNTKIVNTHTHTHTHTHTKIRIEIK